jgi:CRP-like cAMP-binding protein
MSRAVSIRNDTGAKYLADDYHRAAMPVSTEFLKKVSWFEDLDQKSLDAIANAAVEQRYQPGQEIVRQGDTGVGAFIIRSGKVDIIQDKDGKEVKLTTLGPGDVFGEMALLDEFPRSASARAVEPTTALGIQRWHFRGILESHPQLALAAGYAGPLIMLCAPFGPAGRRRSLEKLPPRRLRRCLTRVAVLSAPKKRRSACRCRWTRRARRAPG